MPIYKKRLGGDVSAVFVHAGAGYHSIQNEKVHLKACADAAKVAMTFLKNGGTAVDAVEAAIKVLEDKEITNAGYGSNLAIDGSVECDATIVDHFGRSGAAGAVSSIPNPIHLARLILEQSTRPLSLRRVPPNLLVGQGATDFAFESGMPVLPNDYLVSPGAKERWNRWNKDLKQANYQEEGSEYSDMPEMPGEDEEEARSLSSSRPAYHHQLSGLRNESQPYSPRLTPTASSDEESANRRRAISPLSSSYTPSNLHEAIPAYHQLYMDSSHSPRAPQNGRIPSLQGNDGQFSHHRNSTDNIGEEDDEFDASFIDGDPQWETSGPHTEPMQDVELEGNADLAKSTSDLSLHSVASSLPAKSQLDGVMSTAPKAIPSQEDNITDTVGAIAVDCFGNIAAGSSSGGIGMKHNGRTGPAALVGVGTSVVPVEPGDKNKTCVAAVCSGTGEHMATTSAAGLCASRLYFNQKKGRGGVILLTDEEGALRGFVEKDFMGHPSVKNSHSAGAIGVMAVKKTVDGLWLHFAHNTESFALASMHSEEVEPACVMSRGKGNSSITTGARSLRHPAPRKIPTSTRKTRSSTRKTNSSSRSEHTEEPQTKKPRARKPTS